MVHEIVYLPVETVEGFVVDVFIKMGVPPDDASVCSKVLIASDLRGIKSHGVGRLKMYYDRIKDGILSPTTWFEVIKDSQTTAVVDGHHGMGHVIAYRSMQMAIDKAKEYGMGAVAVYDSTHFGIAGYYALMAVNQGLIGMAFTNARPSVAPTFGVEPLLGTNPIAFGAPTDEEFPFLFDAATSITQRGKIEVLDRAEKPTPTGWVIGREARPTTETATILRGLKQGDYTLLPIGGAGETLGGHKGYGLSAMVEILSAALQGGAFLQALSGFDTEGNPQPHRLGHFFMAIDIDHFIPLNDFKVATGNMLRTLRESIKAPGEDRIYTAGEKEWLMERKVRKEGVSINPNLQKNLKAIQKELGLTQYALPF